jgi:hypothetical protein
VHFNEDANTHWLGAHYGKEGKSEEETREEGEAEDEALIRRLEVFGALSKTSSTDPVSSRERSLRDRGRRDRVGSRIEGVGETEIRTSRICRSSDRPWEQRAEKFAPRHRRRFRRLGSHLGPLADALSIFKSRASCRPGARRPPAGPGSADAISVEGHPRRRTNAARRSAFPAGRQRGSLQRTDLTPAPIIAPFDRRACGKLERGGGAKLAQISVRDDRGMR